jgi:hypothetical protein
MAVIVVVFTIMAKVATAAILQRLGVMALYNNTL